MFKPNGIYYEKEIINYPLGKELIDKYAKQDIPMFVIENHNNILVNFYIIIIHNFY